MGNQDDGRGGGWVAKLKSWGWKVLTLPVMGVVYVAVISDGLRYLIPILGTRLYKLPLPGFAALRHSQAFFRLDLAHVFSIFLLGAVWYMWCVALKMLLGAGDPFTRSGWNARASRAFVLALSVVILGSDACLFYLAMAHRDWGGTTVSLSALIATVGYLGVIIFVSFVSVNLEKPWKED